MKKILLTGLLSAFMLTAEVNAQSKSVFLHKQETMDALGLSKDQQAEIQKITKQSFSDIAKVTKDPALSDQQKKSGKYSVYRKRDEEYKKVLTKEQFDKLAEMRAAAKNQ